MIPQEWGNWHLFYPRFPFLYCHCRPYHCRDSHNNNNNNNSDTPTVPAAPLSCCYRHQRCFLTLLKMAAVTQNRTDLWIFVHYKCDSRQRRRSWLQFCHTDIFKNLLQQLCLRDRQIIRRLFLRQFRLFGICSIVFERLHKQTQKNTQ